MRPKALYFFAKRFYAPVLISFTQDEGKVAVWITNDRLTRVTGRLTVSLRSFEGKTGWTKKLEFSVKENSSAELLRITSSQYRRYDPAKHYLYADVRERNEQLSENRLFFVEPKHLDLAGAHVRTALRRGADGSSLLTVRTDRFVKNLRIEVRGGDVVLDDNYLDIDAGSPKLVRVSSRRPAGLLSKHIVLRWVGR